MTAPQSPAPVAGAVEALAIAREALSRLAEPMQPPSSVISIARLRISIATDALARFNAALAQPAPAVAVEAERELFETWYKTHGQYHTVSGSSLKKKFALKAFETGLAARTAPAVADGQWISVEDRLPDVSGIEDGETVLVANRGGSFAAEWHGTGITGFSSIHGDQFVEVTHWMQLPATPTTIAGMTASRDSQGQLTLGQECPRHRIHDCLACIRRPHGSGSAQEGQAK